MTGAGLPGGYDLAFDIGAQSTTFDVWMIPALALPLVGLALVVTPQEIVDRVFTRGPRGAAGKIFAWMFFSLTTVFAVLSIGGYAGQEADLKAAVKAGRFSVVEGCVERFHPMPASGHDTERMQVGGHAFEYSDDIVTPGFHNSASHGGPLDDASKVRVRFVGDQIVRLEVQPHACPSAPDFPVADDERSGRP